MRSLELLKYSKLAVDELKSVPFDNKPLWSMRWLTTVCVLRAILHVSDKYDFCSSKDTSYIAYWNQKKKDAIFEKFIDSERNLAIKEFNVVENKTQEPSFLCEEDGDGFMTEDGNCLVAEQEAIILDGENAYDLLDQAIVWIGGYISEVQTKFPHLLRHP